MAAPQPPLNWADFSAASERVVQALQASANLFADIAAISSELEQLED
jgi:hypothetical protein